MICCLPKGLTGFIVVVSILMRSPKFGVTGCDWPKPVCGIVFLSSQIIPWLSSQENSRHVKTKPNCVIAIPAHVTTVITVMSSQNLFMLHKLPKKIIKRIGKVE